MSAPSRAECCSLVRKPRPELESHFSSLCTPDWFGVLSAAPFWERRGQGSISASAFRLIASSWPFRVQGRSLQARSAREGECGDGPQLRGGGFELGPSQTWPHVIPGCVGHWHADKPWSRRAQRGAMPAMVEAGSALRSSGRGAFVYLNGEAVHVGPRFPAGAGNHCLQCITTHCGSIRGEILSQYLVFKTLFTGTSLAPNFRKNLPFS